MGTTPLSSWILAARPATLWAGVAPVLVAGGLAAGDGVFRLDAFLVALFAALCIQIGVNFANDVADAARGADTGHRIGPARAVASGLITSRRMWFGIWAAFGAAALAGLWLIHLGGWPILVVGVASIAAALGYTGGPVPYGYRGLGEVFVFVFFGLVATGGARWVHDRSLPAGTWWPAVCMGLLATAILVANNIRDVDTDRAAGKRTLAVMLGRDRTRVLFGLVMAGAFGAVGAAVATGAVSPWALLTLAAAPPAARAVRVVATTAAGPELIGALVMTARIQLVVAVVLAAAAATTG